MICVPPQKTSHVSSRSTLASRTIPAIGRLVLLSAVAFGLLAGCEATETTSTSSSSTKIWPLQQNTQDVCTYKRANLVTILDKPETGCQAYIVVGASGIEK
jgi:hypothetical protein